MISDKAKEFDRNDTQESDLQAIVTPISENSASPRPTPPISEESRFTKNEKWFIVGFTAFVGFFR